VKIIKGWLSRALAWFDGVADRRIQHAVECPECEHTTATASAECHCWDPGCLCVVLHETRYQP